VDFEGALVSKILVAIAAVAALIGVEAAAPALAADMPVKAPSPAPDYSWTGFYFGGNGGVSLDSASTVTITDPHGTFPFAPLSFGARSQTSAMGGVHAGYNYQLDSTWILGIEADWSWTGLKLKGNVSPISSITGGPLPPSNAFGEIDIRGIGSVRGRVGYAAAPNWLVYGTAGWAYARINSQGGWTFTGFTPAVVSVGTLSKTASGWVVGAGTEYHLPESAWIIGAEYLYYAIDPSISFNAVINQSIVSCAAGSACNPVSFGSFDVHEVRARLSYKF
jgi:outer membrane immunogenic protein